jgi:hypothetical protein
LKMIDLKFDFEILRVFHSSGFLDAEIQALYDQKLSIV